MGGDGGKLHEADTETLEGAAKPGELASRIDSLERTFATEITGSMSLNLRATGLAAGSALGILLLALFMSVWLDDNSWELDDTVRLVMKWLLVGSVVLLLVCVVLSTAAAWPRRGWGRLQRARLKLLAQGERGMEAVLVLEMVEIERASNERKGWLLRRAALPLALALALMVAQGALFVLEANPVDPTRTDVPADPEAVPDVGLSLERQRELATTYAPRVWLHPDDPYGPIDPLEFVERSALVWHRPNVSLQVEKRTKVNPARLGRLCSDLLDGCYEHESYLTRELTRPFHGGPHRPPYLNRGRGFALVPDRAAQRGHTKPADVAKVPMLWDVRRTSRALLVTYWFYFGYSRPYQLLARASGDIAAHDGDWENIEVALDPDGERPLRVFFYGHGKPDRVEWKAMEVADSTHPVVYSARESHASYAKAGSRQVKGDAGTATDHTAPGVRWETWARPDGLRRVRDEPWYGFGGAWGRAKDPDGTTGPLGPSQWKLPKDPDPGDLASGH